MDGGTSRKDRNNSSKEAMDFAVCGIIPLGRVEMKTVLGNFDLTIPLENGEIARWLLGWRDVWDNLRVKELFLWTCHRIDRLVGFLHKFAQQCPYYIHWSIVHHDTSYSPCLSMACSSCLAIPFSIYHDHLSMTRQWLLSSFTRLIYDLLRFAWSWLSYLVSIWNDCFFKIGLFILIIISINDLSCSICLINKKIVNREDL